MFKDEIEAEDNWQESQNIKAFFDKEDEMFDKEFPRLVISINKSQMGFRDERGEADGKVMKAFHKASMVRLLERVLEETSTGRDVEYTSLDRMSQTSRDNYFYNLAQSDTKALLNKYITQLK